MLNEQQLAAVVADEPRILLVAAPGSGKTKTLVERLARLLSSGSHPGEILALTFTRDAAREMLERLESRLPGKPRSFWRDLTVSTFHAWCAKILRAYADRLGLVPNFVIYDDVDHDDLVLYAARELGKAPAPGEKKKPGQWTSVKRLWQEEDVRRRYYGLLREAQAVDYDGLERLMLKLLEQPDVAESIRARKLHVLVDEGQDTSKEQQEILDRLDPRNLFVVGDHAQSLYAFRGANVEGFVGLGQRPAWRVIELPINYRSLAPIVAGATRLGEAMAVKGLKQEAAREGGDERHTLRPLAGAGRDELAQRIVHDLTVHAAEDLPGATWRDMAILSPTWDLLDELAPALEAAGIPFHVARKKSAVWDTEPARWIIRCLRVALNPHDHASLWEALNAFTPRVSLGDWAKTRRLAMSQGISVLDAAAAEPTRDVRGSPILAQFVKWTREAVLESADGWPPAADSLIERLRAELVLLHLDAKRTELDAAEQAIGAWRDERTAAGEPVSIGDLLDWYSGRHVTEAVSQDEQGERVLLTSVHGSKGLEWRGVWVLGCEEGKLPRNPDAAGEPIEEQRRMFYVAITRGKDRVRMCWSRHRLRSRFVAEALGPKAEEDEEELDDPVPCNDCGGTGKGGDLNREAALGLCRACGGLGQVSSTPGPLGLPGAGSPEDGFEPPF